MNIKKGIKIILWKLYYKIKDIEEHKLIDSKICIKEWGKVKTIRNDLLARAFLTKRGGSNE